MTGPAPMLTIDARRDGADLVVRLAGELDLTNCRELLDTVRAEKPPDRVVLEADGLTFCDSAGLGVLVRLHKDLMGSGGGLVVRGPTAAVRRVLEMTGLNTIFTVEP